MNRQTEFVCLAHEFERLTGKVPSRIDWRGENLHHWRTVHNKPYPSSALVEKVFGSWGKFLKACGYIPKSTQHIANLAIQHICNRYPSTEVMTSNSGSIDCFINNERVEVKGASVGIDEVIKTPRWRFRLHSRQYSLLVDKVILVGLVGDEPVIEWTFDPVDTVMYLDNKDSLSITVRQAFGDVMYPQYYLETWKVDWSYEEIIEKVDIWLKR